MEATFFDRDGVDFVAIKIDASTTVEVVANSTHKIRFAAEWGVYQNPPRAHNKDGSFKADDLSTPENEAYVKPKKPRKKKAK